MPDDWSNLLVEYRKAIEDRLAVQIARHASVSAGFDPRRVVDIQIQQERERLERALEGSDSQAQVDVYRALLDWLPELSQKLKGRR